MIDKFRSKTSSGQCRRRPVFRHPFLVFFLCTGSEFTFLIIKILCFQLQQHLLLNAATFPSLNSNASLLALADANLFQQQQNLLNFQVAAAAAAAQHQQQQEIAAKRLCQSNSSPIIYCFYSPFQQDSLRLPPNSAHHRWHNRLIRTRTHSGELGHFGLLCQENAESIIQPTFSWPTTSHSSNRR